MSGRLKNSVERLQASIWLADSPWPSELRSVICDLVPAEESPDTEAVLKKREKRLLGNRPEGPAGNAADTLSSFGETGRITEEKTVTHEMPTLAGNCERHLENWREGTPPNASLSQHHGVAGSRHDVERRMHPQCTVTGEMHPVLDNSAKLSETASRSKYAVYEQNA